MSSSSSRRTPLSDSSNSTHKHRNLPNRKSNVPHTKKRKNYKKIEKMRRKAKQTKKKRDRCDPTAEIAAFFSSVHPDCVVQDMDEKEFRKGNKQAVRYFRLWYDKLLSDLIRINKDMANDGKFSSYFDHDRIVRFKDEVWNYYKSKGEAEEYYLPREYNTKYLVFMTFFDDNLIKVCYNSRFIDY